MQRHDGGRRVAIWNADALARVATWVLNAAANAQAAAETLEVDRATLYRLRAGRAAAVHPVNRNAASPRRPPRVSARTLDALLLALLSLRAPDEILGDLTHAVDPPGPAPLAALHFSWTIERACRFFRRPGPSCRVDEEGIHTVGEGDVRGTPRPDDLLLHGLDGLPAWRYQRYSALRERLRSVRAPNRGGTLGEMLDTFVEKAREADEPGRAEMAVVRILEPLLEAGETGFIERAEAEMTPRELEIFVVAGLARERLLLRRERGAARVYDVGVGATFLAARRQRRTRIASGA